MPPSSWQRASIQRLLLCYVTDRYLLGSGDFSNSIDPLLKRIGAAIHVGIDCIQVREKDLCARDCATLVQKTVLAAGQQGTKILVNDRFDVALAENANGVHLGEQSVPVKEVRSFLTNKGKSSAGMNHFMVGASCHSLADARFAESNGADYIFFGPLFPTPSKIAFGEPQGVKKLEEVCNAVEIPVLAIGGVTTENARDCLSAGARGIAAIRLFQDATNIASVVEKLRQL